MSKQLTQALEIDGVKLFAHHFQVVYSQSQIMVGKGGASGPASNGPIGTPFIEWSMKEGQAVEQSGHVSFGSADGLPVSRPAFGFLDAASSEGLNEGFPDG